MLFRGPQRQSEGMETLVKLRDEQIVNGAMPGDPALTPKGLGYQEDTVMRLALGSCACVSQMAWAFISDCEQGWRKGGPECLLQPFGPGKSVLGVVHEFHVRQ